VPFQNGRAPILWANNPWHALKAVKRRHICRFFPPITRCFQSAKPVITRKDIYHGTLDDLNKTEKSVYEDSTQPVEKRLENLISADEKLEEKKPARWRRLRLSARAQDYLPTKTWSARFGKTAWRTLTKTDGLSVFKKNVRASPTSGPRSKHAWAAQ